MSSTCKLTPRQAAFIPEFLATGNATASAVAAGFSVRGASVAGTRMLRNVSVQEALQAHQSADAARLCLRREDVLAGLLEAAEMAKLMADPAGMVCAWKQVGLLMGYFSPERIKVDMNIDVAGRAELGRMNQLSVAQLLALIQQGAATTSPKCQ